MSTVFVQVGQCGNQVGQQFWKHVLKDTGTTANPSTSSAFIHPDGKLRSLNIDAEPKVVRRLMKEAKKSNFRENNVILGKRGCGTNWAVGYHGVKGEKDVLLQRCLEGLRKEIERCDRFCGIIMMHSLSGGTGSGLGSHLAEAFRDEYPMNYLLSCVVAPHTSGESPLQHYNSLLATAHLQRYCDGIMLFQNDEVLYQLSRRAREGDVGISFSKMNELIASTLCGIFLPVDSCTPKSGNVVGLESWELLHSICPMPSLKFIYTNQVLRSKCSWDNLVGALSKNHSRYDKKGEPFKSVANLVIARGDKNHNFFTNVKGFEDKIRAAYNTVSWNPFPVDFWRGTQNVAGAPKDGVSMTIASNYSNIIEYLNHMIERSKMKYSVDAYIHWYWKHGCCQDDFEEAFDMLHTVVKDYEDAIR